MKIIFTYTNLKNLGLPKGSIKRKNAINRVNHAYNEQTGKGLCGYDYKKSENYIRVAEEHKELITCKKCKKILGL